MNNTSKSKQNDVFEDDEIFEDSSFLANFENTSFKETNTNTRLSESNINDSFNKSGLNVSALCCDEEISGYDKLTGKTWIYPTNYPVRDYQFNIIKAAILKNTLVSLPTGLGKTFIAAVIMYNFYRWYPLGKIVFTAPTRPLVAQQIEACYDIIAIPPDDTIEMTGHMQVNTRKTHWQTKRVFFATPQVIYNDIKSGICPSDKIRCLVIDEAHRARGNYAYCQIVGSLDDLGHKTYRLLALSATPGSKVEDVINVVKSLHIAHLELRTENCIDVAPYSHTRKINTAIIKLGPELTQLRQHYVEILDGYARRLKQLNILPYNLGNLSKGRIVMLYKEFQTKERGARHPQHNYIMKDFTLLIALFHGLELLVKHGTRVFLNFFDEHPEKSWIQSDDNLTALLERLRDDLGINPLSLDISILPDGTIPEMPKDLCFGHPKFDRLKEIMTEHFVQAKRKGDDTRAIVFCEYRESVNLVHCLLLQCRPLITPQMFVGQGASGKDGKTVVSQKQQLRVMRNFREGMCNVLVATCVAEEGLDVGSVDLIVCFDISTRSPIRLVQRCGRTGRERGGQVHILVTEGREHQTLMDCMRQKDGLNKKIQQSKDVENNLYKLNPRMVPHDFTPQCQKMYITVAKKHDTKEKNKEGIEKSKKGQKDLRTMLLGRASSSSSGSSSKEIENHNLITEDEFKDIFPDGMPSRATFVGSREYWAMSREKSNNINASVEHGQLNLSTWLEWQRTLQKTVNIEHSKDSVILTELLHYSDAKRFDMPASTQNPVFNSQDLATQNISATVASPAKAKQPKKRLKQPIISKSPAKKDGDIRALFSTATKSTKSYTKLINDLGVPNDGSIPTSLINLLVDLSLDNSHTMKKCYVCLNVCDCSLMQNLRMNKKQSPLPFVMIGDPKFPDIDLIDEIDADSILKCMKNNSIEHNIKNNSKTNDETKNCSANFDLEFDFDVQDDFDTPKDEIQEVEKLSESIDKNFDIGDIEDIFADSSPEEAIEKEVIELKEDNPKEAKETLGFFGLDSIDDIFADYDESIETQAPCIPKAAENKDKVEDKKDDLPKTSVMPLSPSILSGKVRNIPTSPILCTQIRKFQLSTKKVQPPSSTPKNVKKSLFQETKNINDIIIIPDEQDEINSCKINHQKSITNRNSFADTSNKSMFTITQLVEMINKTDNSQSILKPNITKEINDNTNAKGDDDDRSTSPILLTQAERIKSSENRSKVLSVPPKKSTSLIILDSDSDDNTQEYDLDAATKIDLNESISKNISPVNNKRKYEADEAISASPFFNKRPKLDTESKKPLTIQEKVLAALSINKNNNNFSNNNNTTLNFTVSQPNFLSQKENKNPKILNNSFEKESHMDENKNIGSSNLDMLKMFRRDSTINILRNKFDSIFKKSPTKPKSSKQKIDFSDSDDDFVMDEKSTQRSQKPVQKYHEIKTTTNHKVRKKKKKANSFLDLEADLSGSEGQNSGDELSDDSIGSIIDFICDDDNETCHDDIQAHYVRSIKSPINNGGFKIPVLPNKYIREDVLSQFVEEDAYEMDSFCVDSHIGLTQANEVSELELAEIALEEERRKKKRKKDASRPHENGESPLIRRKNKNIKRLIHSESDDSS